MNITTDLTHKVIADEAFSHTIAETTFFSKLFYYCSASGDCAGTIEGEEGASGTWRGISSLITGLGALMIYIAHWV